MNFSYENPKSLNDAVQALARLGPDARVLAGGTDLLVQLRSGARQVSAVVDVKRIPELNELSLGAEGLRLGAAVPCWDLALRDDIRQRYPGVVEAAELIGSMQIQGRASVGGNVCNASPASDTSAALIAAEARCVVVGPAETRRIPIEALFRGPGQTVLRDDEILVALELPPPGARTADAYLRFIPRGEMDIAVVGAGVRITLDETGQCSAARVALSAVAPTPLLVPEAADALIGTTLDETSLERAAEAARNAANPISDKRGTVDYRRRVAGVLTRRAATIAAERARSAS